MTVEEICTKASELTSAIRTIRGEVCAEIEAREAVAKSVAGSRIEPAWAECQALAGPGVYVTLDLTLTRTSSGKTLVTWKYYDEVAKHIESPSLKSLLDKVRAAKAKVEPDTLEAAVAAVEDEQPPSRPMSPDIAAGASEPMPF